MTEPSRTPTPIYELWNDGLGDHWASINLLAQLSKSLRASILFDSAPRFTTRHQQILGALNLTGASVIPCSGPVTAKLDGFDVWATEYLPTRVRWQRDTGRAHPFGDAHPGIDFGSGRDYICTHFDGISAAADKNPSAEEQRQILAWAAKRKLRVAPLGDPAMSLNRVVDLLSRCALFVGSDSGFSHIAHSTQAPTYILQYNLPVVTCHRHKSYVRCDGAGHFTQQADNWLRYLDFLRNPST